MDFQLLLAQKRTKSKESKGIKSKKVLIEVRGEIRNQKKEINSSRLKYRKS